MRQWNIEPSFLCRQHLLGEHVEMHMFKGSIEAGVNIEGYLNRGLVDVGTIKKRHDILAKELIRRGFNHDSNMEAFDEGENAYTTDKEANIKELCRRCAVCRRAKNEV